MSVVGSLLFTDDDRRELPALCHQELQGGNSKSKHFVLEDGVVYEDCTEFLTFLPEVIDQARVNFSKFWSMLVEAVDEKLIMHKSPSLVFANGQIQRLQCETMASSTLNVECESARSVL